MKSNTFNLKLNKINRPINLSHVEKLAKSMENSSFWEGKPIQVNENNEILDGHHRYLAAKKLNIAYHYVVEDKFFENLDFMVNLNSTVLKYTGLDYMHLHAKKGHKDCINFLHYADRFKKDQFHKLIVILGDSTRNTTKNIREGDFKFDYNNINFLNEYEFFMKILQFPVSKELIRVLKTFYVFDIGIFNKIKINAFGIIRSATAEQYYEQILKLINYRMKKNIVKYVNNKLQY